MGLALSTSWNAFRHKQGEGITREIKQLGFKQIELSFNLNRRQLTEIQKSLKAQGLEVTSVHNFCPIPPGLKREKALPDCYSISSLDETERRKAVKFTKITVDTAAEIRAQKAVLHCGRVEIPDRTRELIRLYEKGLKNSGEFKRIRGQAIKERRKYIARFLDNTLRSLEEISAYAAKKKIGLTIENRFYYREIPAYHEIGLILRNLRGSGISYWHDTGHAQVMENLGLARHKDYLEAYAGSLDGMHLHDISGCRDHLAPGQGEFDFNRLKPYLKKNTLKVIEAHHPAGAEDIKRAKGILEAAFGKRV